MDDNGYFYNGLTSLGTAGGNAPSGMSAPNPGNMATQTLNQDLSNIVSTEEAATRIRNFGLGLNIRDTDTNFEREIVDAEDRTKDLTRDQDEALLTQEQCDRLEQCLISLHSDLCGTTFDCREDLKTCADKIFDLACTQEERMKENINCQIEDMKCQFYRQANARWALVSRAVGSSRNTFVIQQQDTAMVDLARRMASLRAELQNNAILQSQQSLERAFSVKAVSRIDNYEASWGNMLGLWQVIRGAKRTLDENINETDRIDRTSNEDSFQDVTTFDWAGKYSEKVAQQDNAATAYQGDYDNANNIVGLLGILGP